MLEFKSINTSSMTNAQLERLMNNYMKEMSSKIAAEKSAVIAGGERDYAAENGMSLTHTRKTDNGMGGTIESASSKDSSSKVVRTGLLNDIAGTKRIDQSSTPRLDTITEVGNDSDDDIQYIGTLQYNGY